MNGQRRTFLTITGVVLLLAAAAAEQAKPAVQPPAATTKQPNDEGATPQKLVAPVRGEAEIGYTNPVTQERRQVHHHHDQDQEPCERRDCGIEGG